MREAAGKDDRVRFAADGGGEIGDKFSYLQRHRLIDQPCLFVARGDHLFDAAGVAGAEITEEAAVAAHDAQFVAHVGFILFDQIFYQLDHLLAAGALRREWTFVVSHDVDDESLFVQRH